MISVEENVFSIFELTFLVLKLAEIACEVWLVKKLVKCYSSS